MFSCGCDERAAKIAQALHVPKWSVHAFVLGLPLLVLAAFLLTR